MRRSHDGRERERSRNCIAATGGVYTTILEEQDVVQVTWLELGTIFTINNANMLFTFVTRCRFQSK